MLSLGVVDGRNVWRADLERALELLEQAADRLGPDADHGGPSCSLLHCPIDLDAGAGARRRVERLDGLRQAEARGDGGSYARRSTRGGRRWPTHWRPAAAAVESRASSPRIHNPEVQQRLAGVDEDDAPPRSIPLPERRDGAAAPPAAAAVAHHHHRLVSADRRGPQGPRRLARRAMVARAVRGLLPRRDRADRAVPGGDRPRRAGPRRVRAERHGRVLWRAARGLRLYRARLGAELRHALREAADHLRRRFAAAADDRPLDRSTPSRSRRGR